MRAFNRVALLLLPLLAAACAPSVRPPVQQQPVRPLPPPSTSPGHVAPPSAEFIPPRIMQQSGLESVIGRTAEELVRQFGTPRLNVVEGDARKLQWSAGPCVLDIYLYPWRPNAEPEAAWVEARRASDGRAVDRAQCVKGTRR